MVKLGLVSKHIVLTDNDQSTNHRLPQIGIILVENEIIYDIIIIKDQTLIPSLFRDYKDWNPVDYSDFYISPGIIDTSARTEWESLSDLTKQALTGGVTLIAVEEGYYKRMDPDQNNLHCDVFPIEVVNEETNFENINPQVSGLKIYLFPPAPQVKSVSHLEFVLGKAEKINLPLIVDATLPDPRMLYMASPLRLEEVDNRETAEKGSFLNFASAFPQEVVKSPTESDESSEEDEPILRGGSLPTGTETFNPMIRVEPPKSGEIRNSRDDMPDFSKLSIKLAEQKCSEENKTAKKACLNIYDDLNTRIKNSQLNHEDLIKVEAMTYVNSGSTSYEPLKKTNSFSKFPLDLPNLLSNTDTRGSKSPTPSTGSTSFSSRISSRPNSFTLKPLVTKTEQKIDVVCDYSHHLANYPVDWETMGVKKIIECLKTNNQVHFTGLSSASALNIIRQEKKNHKRITCEISALNLCFNSACVKPGDTKFKNNPPVRNSANSNLLWDLLKMKGIDNISSCHAFINGNQKLTSNFQTALNGVATLGCTLSSVWFILNKPVSSHDQLEHYIVRLAKWMSMHPAQILGISEYRGSIAKGKLADFIIWNPNEKYRIFPDNPYYVTSPFAGQDLLGKIKKVYLRGKIVYEF
ncbi:hypothetical protein SteCoe_3987 [Stentor coeruleus]|uniref:Amidohydrolase-related domain-containing protein n=1 Tax=Stentor coeruleus TaxID=5963 RepID=A0A1R2CW05_9CILI|nr:hypothetical protein SteCoe_3987 [Stentor coeruleus]